MGPKADGHPFQGLSDQQQKRKSFCIAAVWANGSSSHRGHSAQWIRHTKKQSSHRLKGVQPGQAPLPDHEIHKIQNMQLDTHIIAMRNLRYSIQIKKAYLHILSENKWGLLEDCLISSLKFELPLPCLSTPASPSHLLHIPRTRDHRWIRSCP